MRVVLAHGDEEVARHLEPAFADDEVTSADLASTREPDAFATVDQRRPAAVVLVPAWEHAGVAPWPSEDHLASVHGCWWWARAAGLAEIPVVLLSTAFVFPADGRAGWTEFDRPAPSTDAGRAADAAEQVVMRATREAVIVRVGPLDAGRSSLPRLLASPGGVVGGAGAEVTPAAVADVGPVLRSLAVGRRAGAYHVAGGRLALGECAARLGVEPPAAGAAAVPAPLVSAMGTVDTPTTVPLWPAVRP